MFRYILFFIIFQFCIHAIYSQVTEYKQKKHSEEIIKYLQEETKVLQPFSTTKQKKVLQNEINKTEKMKNEDSLLVYSPKKNESSTCGCFLFKRNVGIEGYLGTSNIDLIDKNTESQITFSSSLNYGLELFGLIFEEDQVYAFFKTMQYSYEDNKNIFEEPLSTSLTSMGVLKLWNVSRFPMFIFSGISLIQKIYILTNPINPNDITSSPINHPAFLLGFSYFFDVYNNFAIEMKLENNYLFSTNIDEVNIQSGNNVKGSLASKLELPNQFSLLFSLSYEYDILETSVSTQTGTSIFLSVGAELTF